MSEQVPFSQTPAEPTEQERIQKRMRDYRIQLTPTSAQAIQALLVSYLKSDQVTIDDLDVMVNIRNELRVGLDDYKNSLETAQKRMLELQEQENHRRQVEIAERVQLEKQKLNEEKLRRKNLEDRIKRVEEEKNFLEKRQRIIEKEEKQKQIQEVANRSAEPVTIEESKPKTTKAFEQAKAKRSGGGSRSAEPTKSKLPEKSKVEETNFTFEPPKITEQVDIKQEPEYEEITIPSRNDLKRMTKTAIKGEGDKLNFELSTEDTKNEMIESFENQTEQLIEKLQSTGEFVSAKTDDDNETNVRDGGTF